jgi:hypothetical protein
MTGTTDLNHRQDRPRLCGNAHPPLMPLTWDGMATAFPVPFLFRHSHREDRVDGPAAEAFRVGEEVPVSIHRLGDSRRDRAGTESPWGFRLTAIGARPHRPRTGLAIFVVVRRLAERGAPRLVMAASPGDSQVARAPALRGCFPPCRPRAPPRSRLGTRCAISRPSTI